MQRLRKRIRATADEGSIHPRSLGRSRKNFSIPAGTLMVLAMFWQAFATLWHNWATNRKAGIGLIIPTRECCLSAANPTKFSIECVAK